MHQEIPKHEVFVYASRNTSLLPVVLPELLHLCSNLIVGTSHGSQLESNFVKLGNRKGRLGIKTSDAA